MADSILLLQVCIAFIGIFVVIILRKVRVPMSILTINAGRLSRCYIPLAPCSKQLQPQLRPAALPAACLWKRA